VVDVRGNPTAVLLTSSRRWVKPRTFRELIHDHGVEQACTLSLADGVARTRMMGGELSLNGTVAAGLMAVHWQLSGPALELICGDAEIPVEVNVTGGPAQTATPIKVSFRYRMKARTLALNQANLNVVWLPGITHAVWEVGATRTATPGPEVLIRTARACSRAAAYGAIFVSKEGPLLVIDPFVHVPGVTGLVHETSCGTGAVAAAISDGWRQQQVELTTAVRQPSGHVVEVLLQTKASDGPLTSPLGHEPQTSAVTVSYATEARLSAIGVATLDGAGAILTVDWL
jgi:hypothetical protein